MSNKITKFTPRFWHSSPATAAQPQAGGSNAAMELPVPASQVSVQPGFAGEDAATGPRAPAWSAGSAGAVRPSRAIGTHPGGPYGRGAAPKATWSVWSADDAGVLRLRGRGPSPAGFPYPRRAGSHKSTTPTLVDRNYGVGSKVPSRATPPARAPVASPYWQPHSPSAVSPSTSEQAVPPFQRACTPVSGGAGLNTGVRSSASYGERRSEEKQEAGGPHLAGPSAKRRREAEDGAPERPVRRPRLLPNGTVRDLPVTDPRGVTPPVLAFKAASASPAPDVGSEDVLAFKAAPASSAPAELVGVGSEDEAQAPASPLKVCSVGASPRGPASAGRAADGSAAGSPAVQTAKRRREGSATPRRTRPRLLEPASPAAQGGGVALEGSASHGTVVGTVGVVGEAPQAPPSPPDDANSDANSDDASDDASSSYSEDDAVLDPEGLMQEEHRLPWGVTTLEQLPADVAVWRDAVHALAAMAEARRTHWRGEEDRARTEFAGMLARMGHAAGFAPELEAAHVDAEAGGARDAYFAAKTRLRHARGAVATMRRIADTTAPFIDVAGGDVRRINKDLRAAHERAAAVAAGARRTWAQDEGGLNL